MWRGAELRQQIRHRDTLAPQRYGLVVGADRRLGVRVAVGAR